MKKWWNNLTADTRHILMRIILVIEVVAILAMLVVSTIMVKFIIDTVEHNKACETFDKLASETFERNEIAVYIRFSEELVVFNTDTLEAEKKNVSDYVEYVEAMKKVAHFIGEDLTRFDAGYFIYNAELDNYVWGYADSYEEAVETVEEYLQSYKGNCVGTEMVVTPVQ